MTQRSSHVLSRLSQPGYPHLVLLTFCDVATRKLKIQNYILNFYCTVLTKALPQNGTPTTWTSLDSQHPYRQEDACQKLPRLHSRHIPLPHAPKAIT